MNGFLVMLTLKLNRVSVLGAKVLTGIGRDGTQKRLDGEVLLPRTLQKLLAHFLFILAQ
jgi:hypothetical protein